MLFGLVYTWSCHVQQSEKYALVSFTVNSFCRREPYRFFHFFCTPFFQFFLFFLEEICSDSVDLILVIDFESFILNRLNCYAEI